jgi:hypothetical protein
MDIDLRRVWLQSLHTSPSSPMGRLHGVAPGIVVVARSATLTKTELLEQYLGGDTRDRGGCKVSHPNKNRIIGAISR